VSGAVASLRTWGRGVWRQVDTLLDRLLGRIGWPLSYFDSLAAREVSHPRLSRADWLGVTAAIAFALAVNGWTASRLSDTLIHPSGFDIWFESDAPRVLADMTDVDSRHFRTSVHPATSILLTPTVLAIAQIAGIEPATAAQILFPVLAATSAGLLLLALRFMTLPLHAAGLLVAIYATSAAYLHWGGIVELHSIGGLSMTVALVALVYGRTRNPLWWVLASAASLSITVTNWMAGLAATIVRWPRRAFVLISSSAFLLIAVLASVQWLIFHDAKLFFDPRVWLGELRFVGVAPTSSDENDPDWLVAHNLRSFFLTSVVAPPSEVYPREPDRLADTTAWIHNHWAPLGAMSVPALAASAAWTVLLLLGGWGAVRTPQLRPVAVGLGLLLAGQVLLHSVYGFPTFLYSLNFLPVLIILAAFAWTTPLRRLASVLAVVVVALGAPNNVSEFASTAATARAIASEHREDERAGFDATLAWQGQCRWAILPVSNAAETPAC